MFLDFRENLSFYVLDLQEVEVNLIITDYCMPGMTGYDLLKKVKVILLFIFYILYFVFFCSPKIF